MLLLLFIYLFSHYYYCPVRSAQLFRQTKPSQEIPSLSQIVKILGTYLIYHLHNKLHN